MNAFEQIGREYEREQYYAMGALQAIADEATKPKSPLPRKYWRERFEATMARLDLARVKYDTDFAAEKARVDALLKSQQAGATSP